MRIASLATFIATLLTALLLLASPLVSAAEWDCEGAGGDMEECLTAQLISKDEELTMLTHALIAKNGDFAEAQSAWSVYREASCKFEAKNSLEGERKELAEVDCRLEMTESRTTELKKRL